MPKKKTKSGLYCIQFYVNEEEYRDFLIRYEKFKNLGKNKSAGKFEVSESAFCRRIILHAEPFHRGAPFNNKNRTAKKNSVKRKKKNDNQNNIPKPFVEDDILANKKDGSFDNRIRQENFKKSEDLPNFSSENNDIDQNNLDDVIDGLRID